MLMTAYSKPIYAYVRRLVVRHDDAEDVCQEIFIRVFRNWKKFKRESALSTWIYKIATREAVRFLHKQAEKGRLEASSAEEVQRLEAVRQELTGKREAVLQGKNGGFHHENDSRGPGGRI